MAAEVAGHREQRRRFGVRRLLGSLGASQRDLEAQEVRDSTRQDGCTAIEDLVERSVVRVTGTVRSVSLRPRASTPTLQVELYDGSGIVHLVWLGRRQIAGVTTGAVITASGRVARVGSALTIFNPVYRLHPRRGH